MKKGRNIIIKTTNREVSKTREIGLQLTKMIFKKHENYE